MGQNKRPTATYKVRLLKLLAIVLLLLMSVSLTSCSLFDTVSFGGNLRIPNILVYAAVFGGIGYMMFHKKK
jgi:hypothetical protein